ncbi:unnamed protein product [Rotaria socialis]|uniref:Amino acid transporter transmembrane domain-containing protein n=3 Tax=Rotaria socialis TaxID=392032 RepID=A0A817WAF9_9BILA|nr:unnamed protein product [Rotaria socialis]
MPTKHIKTKPMTLGKSLYRITCYYSQFYFVAIASILGTGILGLPVTLSESGFQPFVISFLICYCVQVLSIFFFTEVLQKAYYRNVEKLQTSDKDNAPIHVENGDLPTYGSDYDLAGKQEYGEFVELRDMVVSSRVAKVDTIKRCLPNLHSLGELLLPCFLRQLFTLTVLLSLLCLLVSYALAGSQAFSSLLHVDYLKMIPFFCWTWTIVIVFLHTFIQPIISVLTFLKGTLFTGTVVVTLLVGLKINNPVKNDYTAMGDSFLMSTIALGGLMNVMPLMFSKLKQTREEIIGFNVALFLGLTTCVILNILWCWSILAVVPQHSTCLSTNINETIQMAFNPLNESQIRDRCMLYSPSLKKAALGGQISTVPLSEVLENDEFKFFQYVSFIVQLFIVISISVSFMTMGSALHHTIKGVVDSFWNPTLEAETNLAKYGNPFQYITARRITQWFCSLVIFSVVFAIAMSNPKSFKTILEQAGSLFQNIEMGLFLAIMIYKVSTAEYCHYILPFQLPRWFTFLQWIIPAYFGSAVFYDIYHIIQHYTK